MQSKRTSMIARLGIAAVVFGLMVSCGGHGGGGGNGTNTNPVANAGPDQNVMINSKVTLDGSGSTNASTYSWSLKPPPGSIATLSSATVSQPTFTADLSGSYTASLVVSNGTVSSSPDSVIVTAGTNPLPVANAGPDRNVRINSKVTLDGSGSINASTYSWSLKPPPGSIATLSSATVSQPTFTADAPGSYTVSLVVSNGTVSSSPDTMTVTSVIPRAVPDSGQTALYAAGDDGAYTINPPSYTDNLDGTITDKITGLMWQKCSMGKSGAGCATGTLGTYNWYQATGTVDSTYNMGGTNACGGTFLGHSDWRLPTDFELMVIADYGNSGMAINAIFPGVSPAFYWSSTGSAVSSTMAWVTEFYDGQVMTVPKTSGTNAVRCVRGGQFVSDFTDNKNGTVTDNVTGLMWQKQNDGVTKNWATALSYCEGLTFAGHSDWRMPNIKELRSIVDTTTSGPSIDTVFFPITQTSYYWSSTSWAGDAANVALTVSFNSGSVLNTQNKTLQYYVRCVRSLP